MGTPPAKPRPPLPPGPFLVIGLARSGQAAALLLARLGKRVIGCDSGSPEGLEGLRQAGVEVHSDTDGLALLDSVKTVVKSPGVPAEIPVIAAARKRGVEVVGELELAWRLTPDPVIAVTGTNGKTTTTEMIGHLFREAGREVAVAGNIGMPLAALAAAGRDARDGAGEGRAGGGRRVVVCECSSFQLEDATEFAPECAVFLNLSPDHLDRHGSLEAYRDAKLRIFEGQAAADVAVVNGDDPVASSVRTEAETIRFCPNPSLGREACDLSLDGTAIAWRGRPLIGAGELQVLGAHNVANAMAAAGAALTMGLEPDEVAAGLASFTGVPHRLEPVAELDGVLYVNDSKATNVTAAATALGAFAGRVHAILGGSLKGESFAGLVGPVAAACAGCYLIGPAAEPIERALDRGLAPALERTGRRPDDPVTLHRCPDLAAAVKAAARAARPGEVVLLSPGCASFDAFRDYEERGRCFREIVEGLAR